MRTGVHARTSMRVGLHTTALPMYVPMPLATRLPYASARAVYDNPPCDCLESSSFPCFPIEISNICIDHVVDS